MPWGLAVLTGLLRGVLGFSVLVGGGCSGFGGVFGFPVSLRFVWGWYNMLFQGLLCVGGLIVRGYAAWISRFVC